MKLSPFFIDAINKLPEEYDEAAYRGFIDNFGTHFRKRITLGGKLIQLAYTTEDYTKRYSKDDVSK